MESAVPHPAEALGRTRLSPHLSFPGARAPRLCPAVRPRVRLGPSISHRPVAVETAEGGCVRRPSCKLYRGPGMELPDPVRQRLGNFSRTVFSDSNRTGPEYSEGPGEWTRPSATGMACGGLGAGFAVARFCPALKWRSRLQLVLRSAGSALEERPSLGLGRVLGLDNSRPVSPTGPELTVLRPVGRTVSRAAEVAPAFFKN